MKKLIWDLETNMSKQLAIRKFALAKPQEMQMMANVLQQHIVANRLFTEIKGKNYVHVEGWQFAGGMMGMFARIVKVEQLDAMTWLAEAEIVQVTTQKVISRGFAICSKDEYKKKDFDPYAVLSMAQTRAIGKSYRNIIGWVMKLAGYEGTPSEEMGKQFNDTDSAYEKAAKMIEAAKTGKTLDTLLSRVQSSDKLTAHEKRVLEAQISGMMDKFEAEEQKRNESK